jgi:hypothetical protein
MDAEQLYRRLGRLIEVAPPAPKSVDLSPELMKWLGQVAALVKETGDYAMQVEVSTAIANQTQSNRQTYFQVIMLALYRALAIAEIQAPHSAQGSFIPVGNTFDAFAAISKILGSATSDVLIIDPYMDESIVIDFAGTVPQSVQIRLLTDQATVKPGFRPAVLRWQAQNGTIQPLEARLAPAKALHDRAIFVDRTQAWTITQSFKDLAKRSHAEIVRADDTAALKVAAYEAIWSIATVIQ